MWNNVDFFFSLFTDAIELSWMCEIHRTERTQVLSGYTASSCMIIQHMTKDSNWGKQHLYFNASTYPMPSCAIWACGAYDCPYLPLSWMWCYIWGSPSLPGQLTPILPQLPSDWDAFKAQFHHQVKCAEWWYSTLVLLCSQAAAMVTQVEVTTLTLHIVWVVKCKLKALVLLNEELYQMRKVVLQNCLALDILKNPSVFVAY